MKNILFIVYLDKFTEGFYKFIISNFKKQYNYFLFYGSKHEFDFDINPNNCFWCDSYKNLNTQKDVIKIAKDCDHIIYSGLFELEKCVFIFGLKSLKKTYVHLWGNDFYCLKDVNSFNIKRRISLVFRKYVINHAAGVINLINGDYEMLCKYCTPKGCHFIASMCGDGSVIEIVKHLRNTTKSEEYPIKILIGNSATETNQHMQIFTLLSRFKDRNIQIFCPLSYGTDSYRDIIIKNGQDIFGSKFIPLTTFMDRESYFKVIADCKIAIFNNNRQQAMGNINVALALNCKVFIRNDTPMWEVYYKERDMEIYNVEDIVNLSFDEFISENLSCNENYRKFLKNADLNKKINEWQNVFDSIKERNG